jgi:hypothetical protein
MSELVVNLDPGQSATLGLGALHDAEGNTVTTDSVTPGSSRWTTDVDTFVTTQPGPGEDQQVYTATDAGPGTTNVTVTAATEAGASVTGTAQIVTTGPAVEVDVVVVPG